MTTITNLKTQDNVLRQQFEDNPEAVKTAQISTLLERVQQAGKTTSGISEREQLLQILQYWEAVVEEKTGEKLDAKLMAFDPEAEPAVEPATDTSLGQAVPATEANDKPEPAPATATYIPGEPQPDQPQTLAQLFMTMPKAAKIVILVIIALILAASIYWILAPKTDQPVEDIPGTETAVAVAITASAQPTSTVTATATPLIYIESETAVAQSAPIGSPTPFIYIIQTGDTLNKVARTFGVTVQDIAVLNNIYNADSIAVGQELLIPTPGAGTSVPADTIPAVQATPVPQQVDAAENPAPNMAPSGAPAELVIRGSDVALRIAAGPDYQAITTLPQGTFATIIAKTPDGNWYLIQLEDGFTRGWVSAEMAAIIYPADPNTIPTTPMP
ncbi:MAG: LysM peptidoglycan-binding domain-containing protein [Anaerolineae bacterium]|nr:LysM peptidoglycan-binding domain-containing protein [Anaerolineae bacterium]